MRKSKNKPEGIGFVIESVIKKLDTKSHGLKNKILSAWQNTNEEKALAHTRPVAIKRKVLVIEVDSSTWIYALSLKKKAILAEMKRLLGKDKIEDIRFRMGEIT
jgi:predicted nucleic acid-binding Zn ribbon protein